MRPLPVSAPPRVHERLRAAPDGPVPVLHRGPHAVYVDLHGWCTGVVDARAALVPCAMRTPTGALAELPARSAEVRDGVLHLDDRPLAVGRFARVTVPRIALDADRPAPLGTAEVRTLVGAGDGLTPYGDDQLCGWLAVHRAAGVPTPEVDAAVRAMAYRTTLLSATLLDCALHGEVLPEFGDWLQVVGTPAERGRAAALAAIGHTSGRGLLTGGRRALAGLGRRSGTAA
ncbi:DUF2877 domain-containing protein [Nocardioides lianchengensis]|uniref:oxamate carbamoyltransferase subunit AllH family protein n=1 Tax=Nocardioides lianchengensis TaxID=1045774 RepID=UPI001113DE7D|nr:DUF2877 domain-containing protein [Nocardioides lianchengensis]NYG08867.1 hypothetical protein [Nocardioides lianchengensis]